ncbi:hypothetical protein BRD56_11090 [Thermoplasmatales archaeon SW_10_69_26]|nr:MAG: hypothetical protein BRD56_11090 [Thermoplasmatales archaeon SW_10_69_26]
MSSCAVIGGALAAGLLAWVAIALVAWLGQIGLNVAPVRWLGALALGLVSLDIAGAPIHWSLPPSLVALGLVAGLAMHADRFDDPTADE